METENILIVVWIVLAILILLGGAAWTWFQWHLCREAGLNFWYCVQHIA